MNKSLREKEIKIRLSLVEHQKLLDLASPQPLASWIRENALLSRKRRKPKTDPDLLRQLASIGNNLNQIARSMNMLNLSPAKKIQYLAQLESISKAANKIDS